MLFKPRDRDKNKQIIWNHHKSPRFHDHRWNIRNRWTFFWFAFFFFWKKTSADCRAKRLDLGLVALENQVVEGETFAKCGCIGMPFSISMAFFIRLLFDLSNEKNNCSQKKPSYLPSIFKKSIWLPASNCRNTLEPAHLLNRCSSRAGERYWDVHPHVSTFTSNGSCLEGSKRTNLNIKYEA